jgi:hypothetical protein
MAFDEAITESEQFSKRHLLLGNGFSIACRADIFHYGSLYDQANFSAAPELEQGYCQTKCTADFLFG